MFPEWNEGEGELWLFCFKKLFCCFIIILSLNQARIEPNEVMPPPIYVVAST